MSESNAAGLVALKEISVALATTAALLTLNVVKLGRVSKGAYLIGYSGTIPAGATLLLGVPDATNAIDVTHQKHDHLIDGHNLSRFLALIGNAGWWGTKGRCRLFLKSGISIAPVSNEVIFDCPVKPLVCKPKLGGPTLGLSHPELYSLSYASVDDHGTAGRYLHVPAIDSCVYFRNGSNGFLETDTKMRGLVCTSYIGAVWGIAATSGGPMTWSGAQIASWAGTPFYCFDVGVKDRPIGEVKAYLEQNMAGTFLVGSSSHIVLVVRGFVHEFTTVPRRGYNHRSIQSWKPGGVHRWTVGKPLAQF